MPGASSQRGYIFQRIPIDSDSIRLSPGASLPIEFPTLIDRAQTEVTKTMHHHVQRHSFLLPSA